MTFLNATLLFGCLAAILPVVFHFLGRREPQQVVFPAIRFLTKQIETTRRKIQVKRYALLAMRVGVVGAFALALAQPEIHRVVVNRRVLEVAEAVFEILESMFLGEAGTELDHLLRVIDRDDLLCRAREKLGKCPLARAEVGDGHGRQ